MSDFHRYMLTDSCTSVVILAVHVPLLPCRAVPMDIPTIHHLDGSNSSIQFVDLSSMSRHDGM